MSNIEKTVNHFIERQFPEFYREDSPVFVAFVNEYFKWMQDSHPIPATNYNDAKQFGKVSITAQSANVTGSNTSFSDILANGQQIAIFNSDSDYDYSLYTINTVVNNTLLTLDSGALPKYSVSNTYYTLTSTQQNPLYYSRHYYDNMDVDTTTADFLIYFKEKYLKNIQLDTNANIRQLIKHALDIYRSKGTERAADLLFKIVFGVGCSIYYPATDIFRLSDGSWYKPRYLEVSLKESNIKLINKQIRGISTGATAFVEAVVRKTVRGRLIDVLYISAINGNFLTGELINSEDKALTTSEQPVVIGSLTNITINSSSPGSGYNVGDILDVTSISGEGAKGRVSEVSNTVGIVEIDLDNGGYAYSVNAEILISEKAIGIEGVQVDEDFSGNDYFVLFDDLVQPLATITYANGAGTYSAGEELFVYDSNNDVTGTGRILSASGNTTNGTLLVSILSGNLMANVIYTTGNTLTANQSAYTDQTTYANVFARSSNLTIISTNLSGTYQLAEEIYQIDPISHLQTANASITNYTTGIGSNGVIFATNSSGIFYTSRPIYGRASNASANAYSLAFVAGVREIRGGEFISSTNNYVYFSNTGISGSVNLISDGDGAIFSLGEVLDTTETVNVYSDFMADYKYLAMNHTDLSGTMAINSTSVEVTGTNTDFTSELRHTVAGNVSVNATSRVVIGDGTAFLNDIACNDIIQIGNDIRRVREIANNSYLWVNAVFTTSNSETTANVTNYLTFTDGTTYEGKRVVAVTNATHLEVESEFSFSNDAATTLTSWGFQANLVANSSNVPIPDILSRLEMEIGKIAYLTNVDKGSGYNYSPFMAVYEPFTYAYQEQDVILEISGASGGFSAGELVTQEDNNARGIVKLANNSTLVLERLRLWDANNFTLTGNSSTIINGESSGSSANVTHVSVDNSGYLGFNADIGSQVVVGNGAVSIIEIVDSGFGFRQDEQVILSSANNSNRVLGNAELGTQGAGTGFYRQKGGFLSDQKKLFDGLYYQEYSYEIRSSITLNRYEEMLKQLLHVAGTKYFGAFVYKADANCVITSKASRIISE